MVIKGRVLSKLPPGPGEKNLLGSVAKTSAFVVEGLGGTLYDFQAAGAEYACRVKRIILGDEMGLGKTPESLAVLQHENAFPALVICPASLKGTWRLEVEKWLPGRNFDVLHGRQQWGIGYLPTDIVIINYDILGWWIGTLKSVLWKAIIVDESHMVKNRKAGRTKLVKDLAGTIPIRLLLSGTPVVNRPQELITQLDILGWLKFFGGTYGFLRQYCGWKPGYGIGEPQNLEELNRKLRRTCYVRRLKKDVLPELPPIQRTIVEAELSNRHEYEQVANDIRHWFREKYADYLSYPSARDPIGLTIEEYVDHKARTIQGSAEIMVQMNALRQVCARGKLPFVKEWTENFLESGEKLVTFAYHTAIQHGVADMFPGCAHIFGGEKSEETDAQKARFQEDNSCRHIVCSLVAGGLGHTLTASSNVAFIELGWTPKDIDQAEARVHRISQKSDSVNAWFLLAPHTIDISMYHLNEKKRKTVDIITDGGVREREVNILGDVLKELLRG